MEPSSGSRQAESSAERAQRPAIERTNSLARWSLVASLLGLAMILPIVGSILGIVGGKRAVKQVDERGEGGGGIAEAAIVFGWFGVVSTSIGLAGVIAILIAAARS